jgi:hypothetical protein
MSTQRRRGLHVDLRTTGPKNQPTIEKYPGRRFPIQNEIRELEDELNAFNDRIEELEDEGHRGSCDGSVEGERTRFCTSDRRTSLLASCPS